MPLLKKWFSVRVVRRAGDYTNCGFLHFRTGHSGAQLANMTIFEWQQGWEFAPRFSKQIAHFFWLKMSKGAICSQSLISYDKPEGIAHGRSFLVSYLSDSLTSLIFGEGPERFNHIAYQKRGNE